MFKKEAGRRDIKLVVRSAAEKTLDVEVGGDFRVIHVRKV